MLKIGRDLLDHGTLKLGAKLVASHKWFVESSRLIKWLLHADSDWITFGLTTSQLCTFNICWMSTTVVLIKNVLHLVLTGKVLELDFTKCF